MKKKKKRQVKRGMGVRYDEKLKVFFHWVYQKLIRSGTLTLCRYPETVPRFCSFFRCFSSGSRIAVVYFRSFRACAVRITLSRVK